MNAWTSPNPRKRQEKIRRIVEVAKIMADSGLVSFPLPHTNWGRVVVSGSSLTAYDQMPTFELQAPGTQSPTIHKSRCDPGPLGISSEHGDGNNALEVFEKTQKALEHIRRGDGPYFLEFATYRWREHCGPNFDNDIGYRTEEEYHTWKDQDPIPLIELQLLAQGVINKAGIGEMEKTIQTEVDEAFEFAGNSPFPDPEEAFKGLYRK